MTSLEEEMIVRRGGPGGGTEDLECNLSVKKRQKTCSKDVSDVTKTRRPPKRPKEDQDVDDKDEIKDESRRKRRVSRHGRASDSVD